MNGTEVKSGADIQFAIKSEDADKSAVAGAKENAANDDMYASGFFLLVFCGGSAWFGGMVFCGNRRSLESRKAGFLCSALRSSGGIHLLAHGANKQGVALHATKPTKRKNPASVISSFAAFSFAPATADLSASSLLMANWISAPLLTSVPFILPIIRYFIPVIYRPFIKSIPAFARIPIPRHSRPCNAGAGIQHLFTNAFGGAFLVMRRGGITHNPVLAE